MWNALFVLFTGKQVLTPVSLSSGIIYNAEEHHVIHFFNEFHLKKTKKDLNKMDLQNRNSEKEKGKKETWKKSKNIK
ncbi:hypothetical protein NQ318_005550 [Aromia moschata]|uniref:Secreted protein n=1 Tax=Aromia moschata TaxID=1265417 RepID=A0AAV8X3Q2_9CUCU|nr:hypothetical protein NQ318_005550 [Aromia moschata]